MGDGWKLRIKNWRFGRGEVVLVKDVYKLCEKLPNSEDYNLKNQLRRAVVSVALNIAEGKSRKTAKDFSNFLNISAGSLAEVGAILNLCEELNYLQDLGTVYSKIEILGMKINALRHSLNNK